jgi:hypothetical protein
MERKDSLYREYNFAVAWVGQHLLWSRSATRLLPCDVRFGSLADIRERTRNVRFIPKSRLVHLRYQCPLSANSTPNALRRHEWLTRLVLIVLDVRDAIALLRRLKLHHLR